MRIVEYGFEKPELLSQPQLDSLALSTVSDMCPKRSNRLEEGRQLPFPVSLGWLKWLSEINSVAKCVVGETYDYFSSYLEYCNESCRFGNIYLSWYAIA